MNVEEQNRPECKRMTQSYEILKVVLGTFHQSDTKFGNTAGTQCSCISLYAICFSVIKNISIWKSYDLDYILVNGDSLYKLLAIRGLLSAGDLPQYVAIEGVNTLIQPLVTCYSYGLKMLLV